MPAKTEQFKYVGNPGYTFCPPGAPEWVAVPGEVYDLPADHDLGDDFEPVKGNKPKATASDPAASADDKTVEV